MFRTKIHEILEKESSGNICEPDWDYETIERIRDSFQDEASKQQYEQEIVYLVLRESGISKAAMYSPCSNRQWQSATLLAKILIDGFKFQRLNDWQVPKLDVPAGSLDMEFYFQLTTFVLEQYRYYGAKTVKPHRHPRKTPILLNPTSDRSGDSPVLPPN